MSSRRNVPSKLGRELIQMAMRVLFCTDPAELSVLGALVLARGGAGTKRGFEYYTDSSLTETHLIDGDPPAVADRIAAALGDAVHLGQPVRAISQSDAGVEVHTDDLVVAAERVVVATPPVLASRIAFEPALPPGHHHLLLRMVPGAAIRVITTYSEPFWREAGLCGESADPHSPVVITIDQCPMEGTPGVLSSYAFGPEALRLARLHRRTTPGRVVGRAGQALRGCRGRTDRLPRDRLVGGGVVAGRDDLALLAGRPDHLRRCAAGAGGTHPLGRRRARHRDARVDRRRGALRRASRREVLGA